VYFPHEAEEEIWIAMEDPTRTVDVRAGAPVFQELREIAAAARAALGRDEAGEEGGKVIRRMLRVVRDQALPADWANVRFAIDEAPLGEAARARVAEVAEAWPAMHRLLYARLLEKEEPERAPGLQDRIGALIADGRHDEALAALADLRASGDHEGLLDCVGIVEAAGDDAVLELRLDRARAYFANALEAWRYHASCATSGGEGLSRMVDVRRVEGKLSDAGDR
jgi:hypothetical protein